MSVWAGKLDDMNEWTIYMRQNGEADCECVTAMEIIDELMNYVMQYCDAEPVLSKVNTIAKDRMEYLKHG